MSTGFAAVSRAVAVGAVAVALLPGASALASTTSTTVQLLGTKLVYRAVAGQVNTLTISVPAGGGRRFHDRVALTPGGGCVAVDTNTVFCTAPTGVNLDVATGDLNDTITNATSDPSALAGGAGNDTIIGGAGNDLIDGGADADTMKGGAGIDTVTYAGRAAPITADLEGDTGDDGAAGEHDSIGADVENLIGGTTDDVLTGSAAANRLTGGAGDDVLRGNAGNDILDGGAGRDYLVGGAGDDVLAGFAGDDVLLGGPGNNTLYGGDGLNDLLMCDNPASDLYNLGLGGGLAPNCQIYTINDPATV